MKTNPENLKSNEGPPRHPEISNSEALIKGSEKEVSARYPDWDWQGVKGGALGMLAHLAAETLSKDAEDRNWAKKQLRKLIELGKEG